jgi:tryptophan 2,3-dioxygenase
MIGRKIGTGGSIGTEYLNKTADKHRVFRDIGELTTFLIPRSALPQLPQEVENNLGFFYHVQRN